MKVIGYHISSDGIIANSDGDYTDKPPYMEFLLQPKPDSIKILYYLGQNISNLAKLIKLTQLECYRLHNSIHGKCFIPPYRIQYIQNRFLKISKGSYKDNPFAFFYDAHQYSDTRANEVDNLLTCLSKAIIAKDIGEQVKETIESLGIEVKSLVSPTSIFEKNVIQKYDLPTVDDMPEEAGEYAYECCKGNWLEAFQQGHWEKAYDYDISSAYPSQASKLLDIRLGDWIPSNKIIENAAYGYCKGTVKIKERFSPILHKNIKRDSLNPLMPLTHTPVGQWTNYISKKEIEFINKWHLGTFDIEKGWWWIPRERKTPLNSLANWLFLKKEEAEPGIKRNSIKRIMSGNLYGMLLEIRDGDFGERFNPVWGAEIEINNRLEVAEMILKNNLVDDVIHIAVDGAVTSKQVPLPNNGMGSWKLSNITPCICAGTGQVALRDTGKGDFHLAYDWLKEAIEKYPDKNEYTMSSIRPISIAEAANGRHDKLGELQEIKKYINIGNPDKRCYKEKPKTGKELLSRTYSSFPWDVSLLQRS